MSALTTLTEEFFEDVRDILKTPDKGNFYHLDINVTEFCNMACLYCYEKNWMADKDYQPSFFDTVNFIDKFLASEFLKGYDGLVIGFWGGEPTANLNFMVEIIDYYMFNDSVCFFIYTNGYRLDSVLKSRLEVFKHERIVDRPKLLIQISYDGNPIHDRTRLGRDGFPTSRRVKESIRWCDINGIPFVLKSTLPPPSFRYMEQAYLDIRELCKTANYAPTIDYYGEYDDYSEDLEKALIKIARHELEFYKEEGKFFLTWFEEPSKAFCTAGKNMCSIDTDGTIYNCHGCFYSDNKELHKITDIFDSDAIKIISGINDYHSENFRELPEECRMCTTNMCIRCNVAKFDFSEKENYFERWRDYTNQPLLCKYYRISGKIMQALNKLKEEI